jgi:hypothetical protein
MAISSPPATTEYLRWSDQPVRFSKADHPRKVPRPPGPPYEPEQDYLYSSKPGSRIGKRAH